MPADHEDYETGAAPAAHGPSHELDGDDEISVAGLSGETVELAAHKILPAIHHVRFTAAEAMAAINNIFGADGKADVDINLDTHKLINVVDPVTDQGGDTKKARNDAISTHAGLATVHQNAPALILTHKGDASAHHAKYTDAEVRAVFNPISFSPADFMPHFDTYDFDLDHYFLHNRTALTIQYFYAGVHLPNGCTVTKVTLYGYRDDALAVLDLYLYRMSHAAAITEMATLVGNWSDGMGSIFDDSIDPSVIDNNTYQYALVLWLNPNDAVTDVKFIGAKIEFTG